MPRKQTMSADEVALTTHTFANGDRAPLAYRETEAIRKAGIPMVWPSGAAPRHEPPVQVQILGGVRTLTMAADRMIRPDRLALLDCRVTKTGKPYIRAAAEYLCRACRPMERDEERARPDQQDEGMPHQIEWLSGYQIAEAGAILCHKHAAEEMERRHPQATRTPQHGDEPTDHLWNGTHLPGYDPQENEDGEVMAVWYGKRAARAALRAAFKHPINTPEWYAHMDEEA